VRSTRTRITSRCGGAVLALLLASSHVASGDAPDAGGVARTDVRITSADDLSLFVRHYGSGETPIVLLTGGPGYSGDYLEEVAVRLAKEHRVILPDQRGTGRSVINPWDVRRCVPTARPNRSSWWGIRGAACWRWRTRPSMAGTYAPWC